MGVEGGLQGYRVASVVTHSLKRSQVVPGVTSGLSAPPVAGGIVGGLGGRG